VSRPPFILSPEGERSSRRIFIKFLKGGAARKYLKKEGGSLKSPRAEKYLTQVASTAQDTLGYFY